MANVTRSPFVQAGDGALFRFLLDARFAPGSVFFVQSTHSNAGDTAGRGQSPDAPLSTIDYAIGLCTADKGDLIIVLPGHVETVIAAAGVALDVAGVSIVGIGEGRQRPRVNFTTAAGASFDVTAARCRVEGLYFTNGIDAQTAMLNVQAADFTLRGCEFSHGDASTQAALGLLTTASADRLRVQGCFFHGTSDAGTTAAISLVGGDAIEIRNNTFSGAYHVSGGVIKNATTDSTNLIIADNLIQNLTASNTKSIVLTATSTGQIAGNRMQILSGTAPITGAAMSWVGANYYANAVATAGTLI